jgi:hypothetical protein
MHVLVSNSTSNTLTHLSTPVSACLRYVIPLYLGGPARFVVHNDVFASLIVTSDVFHVLVHAVGERTYCMTMGQVVQVVQFTTCPLVQAALPAAVLNM